MQVQSSSIDLSNVNPLICKDKLVVLLRRWGNKVWWILTYPVWLMLILKLHACYVFMLVIYISSICASHKYLEDVDSLHLIGTRIINQNDRNKLLDEKHSSSNGSAGLILAFLYNEIWTYTKSVRGGVKYAFWTHLHVFWATVSNFSHLFVSLTIFNLIWPQYL